jgi:hypothetical protein
MFFGDDRSLAFLAKKELERLSPNGSSRRSILERDTPGGADRIARSTSHTAVGGFVEGKADSLVIPPTDGVEGVMPQVGAYPDAQFAQDAIGQGDL